MKYLVAFACFLAVAYGQNWGMMPQQQQNGGNFLNQLLQAHMGQQQNNYGNQYQQQGMYNQWQGQQQRPQMPQQNNMNNNVLGSLLGNLLASVMMGNMRVNQGNNMPMPSDDSMDEMARMEELMKMSMATEMFDLMRAYNTFKENEEEFGKAMSHLCYLVNATWVAARRYKYEVYNKTTDNTLKELEEAAMTMTEEEKMDSVLEMMANDQKMYEEIFFRMATWSCWAGQQYMESAIKLDKMNRGDKCDH